MIRISIVSYTNTLPYKFALEKSEFIRKNAKLLYSHPADCAKDILEDRADIGLVPIGSLKYFKDYSIVTDYCLAAKDKVESVLLVSDVEISEIETILLDYQSMTSVELCKIIAKHKWCKDFDFIDASEGYISKIKGKTAGVIIGDRALSARKNYKYTFDLAKEWFELTALPMVFAVWISNGKADQLFLDSFGKVLEYGLGDIELVIEENMSSIVDFDLDYYLRKCISYRLNIEERKSIDLFQEYLKGI